jgi:Zn-dependent M28 family amino/carboxypeptidase
MLDRLLDVTRTVVRVRIRLSCHRLPDGPSANVVGEITGREKPDQIVLLGAHLDSWDLGHGALDDGAGVAIALSAAKLAATRRPPRRTLRVVLFAGEEMSGAGAKQYAADHIKELEKHVVALEADAGDGTAMTFRWLGSLDGKGLAEHVAGRLATFGIEAQDDAAEGGSDVGPLRAQGVPVVDLGQDMTKYFDYHHTANDTFDKVDPESLAQATRAFAVAAWSLGEAGDDLGRVPQAQRVRRWGK